VSWVVDITAAFGLLFLTSIFSTVGAGLNLRAEESPDFESAFLFFPTILLLFHLAVLKDCSGMSIEEVLEEVRSP